MYTFEDVDTIPIGYTPAALEVPVVTACHSPGDNVEAAEDVAEPPVLIDVTVNV
jgi:hypothetical protein